MRHVASGLKGVEFVDGGIAVLVVAALVHVGLGQVHFGNHGIDADDGVGIELACLHDGVDDGARPRAAAESGKDVDKQFLLVAGNLCAAGKGVFHGVHKGDGVAGKEESPGAAHLPCGLAEVSDGRFDGCGILDNAFH